MIQSSAPYLMDESSMQIKNCESMLLLSLLLQVRGRLHDGTQHQQASESLIVVDSMCVGRSPGTQGAMSTISLLSLAAYAQCRESTLPT